MLWTLMQVANRLSREVLGDTAVELHKTFLDDPFQELIPTESIMFDKQDKTTKVTEFIYVSLCIFF